MFLLKIKCSEVKVAHFPLKEQKVELKQTCSLRLLRIWRRRAHVGHRDNPGSLSLILLQGNMT